MQCVLFILARLVGFSYKSTFRFAIFSLCVSVSIFAFSAASAFCKIDLVHSGFLPVFWYSEIFILEISAASQSVKEFRVNSETLACARKLSSNSKLCKTVSLNEALFSFGVCSNVYRCKMISNYPCSFRLPLLLPLFVASPSVAHCSFRRTNLVALCAACVHYW